MHSLLRVHGVLTILSKYFLRTLKSRISLLLIQTIPLFILQTIPLTIPLLLHSMFFDLYMRNKIKNERILKSKTKVVYCITEIQ